MSLNRLAHCALLAALAILPTAQPAAAQQYPERPVRLMVPFPAGGAVDLVARLIATQMSSDLGQPMVVENKPGAGGVVATDALAKSPPDGYMLLLTTPNHTINGALHKSLPYDTEKDIAPVSIVAEIPELLVSHPAAPFTTLAGMIDYAKKNPGKLNYSSAGNGTLPHVTMELLLRRAGIDVVHVPYRGAAPAMTDLLAGQVQLKHDTFATANQHVAAGRLNALGFASRTRSSLMPNVPAIAEAFPGYEGILWLGIVAPARTPKPVIDKLAASGAKAVRAPDMIERFKRDGIEPVGGKPEEFAALVSREIVQWRELAKSTNIALE